jgi:acyl-coenzyme A thioesterase PaaI-like protein
MPPRLEDIQALKDQLQGTMIDGLGLQVIDGRPGHTTMRMPYQEAIMSGFHGAAVHHGALVGLATTCAFLHALTVLHPEADTVEQWMAGPQPWIVHITADVEANAESAVTAESRLLWRGDNLKIATRLWDEIRSVATVVTRHRV